MTRSRSRSKAERGGLSLPEQPTLLLLYSGCIACRVSFHSYRTIDNSLPKTGHKCLESTVNITPAPQTGL
jgi:hypothetical protein